MQAWASELLHTWKTKLSASRSSIHSLLNFIKFGEALEMKELPCDHGYNTKPDVGAVPCCCGRSGCGFAVGAGLAAAARGAEVLLCIKM